MYISKWPSHRTHLTPWQGTPPRRECLCKVWGLWDYLWRSCGFYKIGPQEGDIERVFTLQMPITKRCCETQSYQIHGWNRVESVYHLGKKLSSGMFISKLPSHRKNPPHVQLSAVWKQQRNRGDIPTCLHSSHSFFGTPALHSLTQAKEFKHPRVLFTSEGKMERDRLPECSEIFLSLPMLTKIHWQQSSGTHAKLTWEER